MQITIHVNVNSQSEIEQAIKLLMGMVSGDKKPETADLPPNSSPETANTPITLAWLKTEAFRVRSIIGVSGLRELLHKGNYKDKDGATPANAVSDVHESEYIRLMAALRAVVTSAEGA